MKIFNITTIIIVLLFNSLTLWAVGGSSGTGGGDRSNWDTGAAWFMGAEKSIKICAETSQDFGFPQAKINGAIQDIFKVWENYIQSHQIEYTKDFNHQLLPSNERMSFKTEIMSHCDGSENLKLYLGVTNGEVEQAKIKYVNPIGIAERSSFNSLDGFAKGFIWIAKPTLDSWQSPNPENLFLRFVGILSHELGHVFGCDHVEGTIMQKDIDIYLRPNKDFAKKVYSIDYDRQLVPCFKCWSELAGRREKSTGHGIMPEVFNIFTGRRAVGISRIILLKDKENNYFFEISDDQEHLRLPIRFSTPIKWLANTSSSIFYVDRAAAEPGSYSERMYRRFGGSIGYSQAQVLNPQTKNSANNNQSAQGEWLPLMLIYNEDTVVKASFVVNGTSYDLFKSVPKPENSLNK